MNKKLGWLLLFFISLLGLNKNQAGETVTITICPDSVLNDVSHHPVGINLDYFMDGDRYPNPKRGIAATLQIAGEKILYQPIIN